MNILHANLKHLYQKRSFWLIGLIFGVSAFGVIKVIEEAVTENKRGGFSAPILWMFFVSIFIASLPIDVLTKPFSSCLPNHRKIPREFLFCIGLVLSFLWSLSFLFYTDLNIVKTILTCLSAFSVFTISYWFGAWFVSKVRNWSVVFALLPLIMLGNGLLNMSTVVEHTIVESSIPMILLGGIINVLAWRYWGRANLSRQYCGKLWMGAFDAWNKEKMSKFRQVKLAEKDKKNSNPPKLYLGVEDFFVSRISGAKSGSLQQYIWGALYKSFGRLFTQHRNDWIRFLMLMLPILCFFCYMPGGGKNIIFLMPALMVTHMSLGVYSSLLTDGPRRQRFFSALTMALAASILATIAVAILVSATHLLEMIMPILTFKGNEFNFAAINMALILIPFSMIPLTLTISLIFFKKQILVMLFVIIIFQILFAITIVAELTIMNAQLRIGTEHIIILLLISWSLFITTLRYISMRCCLVKQS